MNLATSTPQGPKMRYEFIPRDEKPGYVAVYDHQMKQPVAELWQEHAQMIFLMYSNLHQRHPFAAEEFMYGHIMGYTLMMVHADKYPKVEVIRSPDGKSFTVRMREENGRTHDMPYQKGTEFEKDITSRITPNKL